MVIYRFFKSPGLLTGKLSSKLEAISQISPLISDLESELCYYIESSSPLTDKELDIIKFVLNSPFKSSDFQVSSNLNPSKHDLIIEIGPRLNFSTAFSSNAVSIFKFTKLDKISRVEAATRYLVKCQNSIKGVLEEQIVNALHDKMTECRYLKPLETFDHGFKPENWYEVDILKHGRQALEQVSATLGLAFDDWDLDYYTNLFKNVLKRNPTSVECFDLAQSNSEHSRHWFFRGKMIIDGEEQRETLFSMIQDTQSWTNGNNVIKFSDNSSAIKGFRARTIIPSQTHQASNFKFDDIERHLIFTAETHNFPTGVAPFSGATTGTGGRIRDIQGCGRGGYYIAGTAGYSVGNLLIPGYDLPWEDKNSSYPSNFASPLEIIIEASNGASDYGNKFGEPVIGGFARTFGMTYKETRTEWIKPIMFSGGVGMVDADMTNKLVPEKGMEVIKIGGPVYRIGVGGGAASSVVVQGDNKSELDFGAVQRGDPEMEQKLNRLIRACTEMGSVNPILSIHDQGAGGNGNVLKELVEPAGAVIFTKKFELGDPSISTMELWGAEYQENDAILCKEQDIDILKSIANREKCPINFVGKVTGSGKIVLSEEADCDASKYLQNNQNTNIRHPVDLDLELVLGKMPQKVFRMNRETIVLEPVKLPANLDIGKALERVLRLPSVASKRYLTNKVDRCVTGLIAQQQCVGPLHTPLADVAVTAISHFSLEGIATSIGEQPIKGMVNVAAGARMTVIEAISNMVFAKISDIKDIKCSGNWMWAAKLPGEGAKLYDACREMCILMNKLGIAIDGGKDSLSMAARVKNDIVKSPGTLVVSCYAPCPNIKHVVTPDLKYPSQGKKGALVFVDLSQGKSRIGGTALAQVFNQLGDSVPDVENAECIIRAFNVTQRLIYSGLILAGHDVSDGGLIVCLLEMAFAGLCGLQIDVKHKSCDPINILFAEEVGWVLEVNTDDLDHVLKMFENDKVPAFHVGSSEGLGMSSEIMIKVRGDQLFKSQLLKMMKMWEETSYELEKRQTNIQCAMEEFNMLENRKIPCYKLNFNPDIVAPIVEQAYLRSQTRVAVIREEGINGDREMAASLAKVGFEVWDVTMQDLLKQVVTLDHFRGVIFPGGFSYADVLGSAKGWAASLLFHPLLRKQLDAFVEKPDTFSLGVCNGCQLMSLLGWIGSKQKNTDIVLDHNKSERFECRWSTVKIEKSPAIMLKEMEGSILGVWIAHGEGRFTFKNDQVLKDLKQNNCLAIKYTDDDGIPTEIYPMNPNGSVDGIAGICSVDGRHLAMMPHPERCTDMWQWPYIPPNWENQFSPWLKMFANAFTWCESNK
ncbi:phosphoribosylformylglycinamidine synthase [Chelonus insularis]|uniref:phosphoribosylformylglycinamidine synthase n=1 Tax=Chelonus insularis TaxID=460826 RepID=UPI00158DFA87|nr:phosphoribosylformylglycinamidine synthase [Chelonus insularis]XP_034937149.1 phosphoribosylformylglycinamidine synthase [Chelonus insularis]